MRMSDRNRLMAIARNQEYIGDHKRVREKSDELLKKINELCKPGPNPPNALISDETAALHELCLEVCRKWKLKQLIPPFSEKYKPVDKNAIEFNRQEAIEEITEDAFSQLVGDRRPARGQLTSLINPRTRSVIVRLSIDMTKSKGELLSAFTEKLEGWKKYIPKEAGKRKTEYDPWDVYDQHKSGLSFSEIARRLSGKDYPRGKKSPAYSEEFWPPYKRVKKAYEQAVKMIQTVNPR